MDIDSQSSQMPSVPSLSLTPEYAHAAPVPPNCSLITTTAVTLGGCWGEAWARPVAYTTSDSSPYSLHQIQCAPYHMHHTALQHAAMAVLPVARALVVAFLSPCSPGVVLTRVYNMSIHPSIPKYTFSIHPSIQQTKPLFKWLRSTSCCLSTTSHGAIKLTLDRHHTEVDASGNPAQSSGVYSMFT